MPHQSGGLTVVVEHRLALVAKAGMMRIDCDTILGNEEALPREIERLEPIDRTRLDRKVFARPEPTHRPGVESSGRSEERRVGNECVSTCRSRGWRHQ